MKPGHILNLLQKEYQQAKTRQKPGASKNSGFMNGIVKAMEIVRQIEMEEIENELENI